MARRIKSKTTTKSETAVQRAARLTKLKEARATKLTVGFVDFIREQGVVGLAVGLAMGAAAGAAVKAIVDGFVSPVIGFILGGSTLANKVWNTGLERGGKELVIAWGSAANAVVTLLATGLVIYFVVMGLKLNRLDKKKEK
ncbi:MAG: MscL family protein [Candidatus Nomurabacteria bacterium]|nr:MAG: MscL family protein [Candidatus Nomurabacteria bacterium]HRV75866.1 MscL family protein [Candidatus Saccharimonadales bacterium]